MGLLSILKKLRQKEKEIRVLILGLDNAGKTTILKRINGEDVSTISPTLGFNIKTLEFRGYKLNVWDIGGQKSIRSYWRNYFEQTDALVWVVDSADTRRLQSCRNELEALLKEERLAGASLLVFANKQDLPGALSESAIRKMLELDAIKTHHWHITPCSAMARGVSHVVQEDGQTSDDDNGHSIMAQNILKGLDWMVSDVASRIYLLE